MHPSPMDLVRLHTSEIYWDERNRGYQPTMGTKGLKPKSPHLHVCPEFQGIPFLMRGKHVCQTVEQYKTLKSWESYPHQRNTKFSFEVVSEGAGFHLIHLVDFCGK